MFEQIDVLDAGYVRLVGVLGSDLSVVNAARVSFQKESQHFEDRDAKLLRYLATHGHTSPFRHAALSFEIKAPLMVCRQWWKYVVGSVHEEGDGGEGFETTWNEASRRYVTLTPECYAPSEWRRAPDSKKQGSGGPHEAQDLLRQLYDAHVTSCLGLYQQWLDAGVAPEQARLVLPAYALYTIWRWTASLQAVVHFLKQRLADDAQQEMRAYALAVERLVRPQFPHALGVLVAKETDK